MHFDFSNLILISHRIFEVLHLFCWFYKNSWLCLIRRLHFLDLKNLFSRRFQGLLHIFLFHIINLLLLVKYLHHLCSLVLFSCSNSLKASSMLSGLSIIAKATLALEYFGFISKALLKYSLASSFFFSFDKITPIL